MLNHKLKGLKKSLENQSLKIYYTLKQNPKLKYHILLQMRFHYKLLQNVWLFFKKDFELGLFDGRGKITLLYPYL